MKILFLCCMLLSLTSYANLLVPTSHSDFDRYERECSLRQNQCTYDYFTDLIIKQPSPAFDLLVDSLDFNSKKYTDQFYNNLIRILNTEILDQNQLELTLALLKQFNLRHKNLLYTWVENDLQRIEEALNTDAHVNDENFAFIFKKKISLSSLKSMRSSVLKIPFWVFEFTSIPLKRETKNFNPYFQQTPLLSGDCRSWKAEPLLRLTRWRLFTTEACENRKFTSSERVRFTKEPDL
jgi:hypothetical protein